MIELANNLTGFVVLVATLGIAAQWLAWRFHLPAILLLSITGLVAGPWLGWRLLTINLSLVLDFTMLKSI
jgi:NhaP-type Na+/H+ or K+/H+ antiporter